MFFRFSHQNTVSLFPIHPLPISYAANKNYRIVCCLHLIQLYHNICIFDKVVYRLIYIDYVFL
jgi:hypothetical protein